MSAAPAVISPQSGADITACWRDVPLTGGSSCVSGSPPPRLMSGDVSSSSDEYNAKVRKPYTITKQRERWTEAEHAKFLEALKLYGRAWRRIEEHIGTKTAVQIRSHAQKFFSKLEKEASQGSSSGKVQDIEIPPPRPKRKPSHPYPRKVGTSPSAGVSPEFPSIDDQPTPANPCNSKSAVFAPYGKGDSAACSKLLHGNLIGQKNPLEAQAGLKLFGKTVVLPTSHKEAAQKDLRKAPYCETFPEEKLPSPTVQTHSIQKEGFSPYVKAVTKFVQICPEGGSLEGSDESNVEVHTSTDVSVLTDCESKKTPCQGNEETTPYTSQVKSEKVTPIHESPAIVNSQFSSAYAGSQSNPAYLWMDSFFHNYGRPPVLPQSAGGRTDGLPATAVTPWHLLQASAINQSAAYVAALAAARWAELVTGTQAGIGNGTQAPGVVVTANCSEGQKVPSFPDEFNNSTLQAAAASWWALKGVIPPPFIHIPPGARSGSKDDPLCPTPTASRPAPKNADEISILHEVGDHTSDAPTNDEDQDICTMMAQKLQHGDGRPTTGGDPKSISCIQEIDASILEDEKSLQRSCSSGDEFEQDEKKSAEGSSSGSNTPASRCQSSEPETTNTSGSDVKEDVLSKKQGINNYACGQEILVSSSACPKMNFKNMEKGKRHQHKDIRYGENESGKRLKSCAHDVDSRKEVSQEGRKAFEALFVSKTLPQTFSTVSSTTGVKNHPNEKHTTPPLMPPNNGTSPESWTEDSEGGEESHPTLESKNDKLEERKSQEACTIVNSSSSNITVKPGSVACCEDSRGKAHASGAADDRLPLISKDANASAFTIIRRPGGSGFVPYRRPSMLVVTEATTSS